VVQERKSEIADEGTPSPSLQPVPWRKSRKAILARERRQSARRAEPLAVGDSADQAHASHESRAARSLRSAVSRFRNRLSRPTPRRRIPARVRRVRESEGNAKELPQFTLLYLPDDHTGGTRPGKPTPQASVADNDLAVGRVVDAVSHSPYWDDTAIFVLEDDAQDGADHVDAHRSIAFVISKYAPRAPQPFVDHNFYTTVSIIHTMEALLGLPPMNLFDAHAPLMAPLFSGPGTQPPYQVDDRICAAGSSTK
jgi:arylsulfatase A-like enzyme